VTRLTESDNYQFASDWSVDGRLLFVDIEKLGSDGDLAILPLAGGDPYYLTRTPFIEFGGVFSPDDRWIAYLSDESGRQEVYVMPSSGSGGKWQISTEGGTLPVWRGEELFYWAPRGMMMAVRLEIDGDTVRVGIPEELFPVRVDPQFPAYDVTADGQRFLVNTTEEGGGGPITLVTNWTEDLD
jgi:Tol biopolymer transport system component